MTEWQPVKCVAVRGSLKIVIPAQNLRFASEHHPAFWDGERGASEPNMLITDMAVFAQEIAHEINAEWDESGQTLLTRMLDDAILNAVENGCEGVKAAGGDDA